MSSIDFPNSPTASTAFAAGRRLWKFTGAYWSLVPYGFSVPTDGAVDGGTPSFSPDGVKANAGAPTSNFAGLAAIDGGTV